MNARSPSGDPWLLTPGPLTTSPEVKEAARHDYGSRDRHFIEVNRQVRERLVAIAGGQGTHVCVPLQGSGTFVVEAMLGTFVPRDGKVLILANGAYGQRMARICGVAGRRFELLETPEDTPVDPQALDAMLAGDAQFTHVAVVHCETTSGVVNPVEAIARVCAAHSRELLVDTMSAFGALPLDARSTPFRGGGGRIRQVPGEYPGTRLLHRAARVPGARPRQRPRAQPRPARPARRDGEERPVALHASSADHPLAAPRAGGVRGRGRRRGPGETLPEQPEGPGGRHARSRLRDPASGRRAGADHRDLPHAGGPAIPVRGFLRAQRRRGYVIYPGKLTLAPSFRIGCIGRLGPAEMRGALAAVEGILEEMGVASGAPGAGLTSAGSRS